MIATRKLRSVNESPSDVFGDDTYLQYLADQKRRNREETSASLRLETPAPETGTESVDLEFLVLIRELQIQFRQASSEEFEYGMRSNFIDSLSNAVRQHGVSAITLIGALALQKSTIPTVAFEALRWLGSVDSPEHTIIRRIILQAGLKSDSRWVRDGAVIGLDVLGDPLAASALQKAIEREPNRGLRKDMEAVLAELIHA